MFIELTWDSSKKVFFNVTRITAFYGIVEAFGCKSRVLVDGDGYEVKEDVSEIKGLINTSRT